MDLDGSSAYSPVVAVQASGNATGQTLLSSVYPNPFSTRLTLELGLVPAGEVALVLTDMQGRQAYATTVHAAVRTISVALPGTLAPGNYVLTVQANGLKASRRVVRQ